MAEFKSPKAVYRALSQEGIVDRPCKMTIKRIFEKFCETGSIHGIWRSGHSTISEETQLVLKNLKTKILDQL